jgi:hypothetical protein
MLYSRLQTAEIARVWALGEDPSCPDCLIPLSPQVIHPRSDVAYVRRRVILLCQRCRRSAVVEARRRDSRRVALNPERTPSLLGWKEWVVLDGPDPRIIEAKVDSGARTSALHAEDVEIVSDGSCRRAQFFVWHRSGAGGVQEERSQMEALVVDERVIRSSSGDEELRPVVVLPMRLAGVSFFAEVTLTRRDAMQFRMLVGRTSLRGRFWVDAGSAYLGGAPFLPASAAESAAQPRPPETNS